MDRRVKLLLIAAVAVSSRWALADEIVINSADTHGRTIQYTYDARGTTATDRNGNTTTYTYDSRSSGTGGATTYTYDALDKESRGNTSTYTYDANSSATDGSTSSSSGDDTNSGDTYNDSLGGTTRYQYDSLGRDSVQQEDRNGRTFRYDYNPNSGVTGLQSDDTAGNTTRYTYDALNRQIITQDHLSTDSDTGEAVESGEIDFTSTTRTQYDYQGEIISTETSIPLKFEMTLYDVEGETTLFHYEYDGLSRPSITINPADVVGSLSGELQSGHTFRYTYSYDLSPGENPDGGSIDANFTLTVVPLPTSLFAGLAMLGCLWLPRLTKKLRPVVVTD